MGYYNPLLAYGLRRYVEQAAASGVDGLIVVDLPPEEAGDLREACAAVGMACIHLAAPTSGEERLALIGRTGTGFVYCVSVRGVTSARDELPVDLAEFVGRIRRYTDLPVAVGFGISRREHVEEVGRYADAAVIGSAFVRLLAETPAGEREQRIREYVEMVTGRTGADVRS
jgi:tryptophan synthase alpha chain